MPYSTLIIDDEQPARLRLEELLAAHKDTINIVDHATDGFTGQEKIKRLKPDLIFLDIQMPGMSGFEMLAKLDELPLIIFSTAYDAFALQAFETNSVDYLLKPVKPERLAKTIQKLNQLRPKPDDAEVLQLLRSLKFRETEKMATTLTIKNGSKMILLKIKDIAYFKATDKYVTVFMRDGNEHLADQSLQHLEELLPPQFKRIHRSLLLNKDFIKEVHGYFNSRFALILEDKGQTKLISGRSFQQDIKDWIKFR